MTPRTFVLEVWGELACFTDPVMKVERFSYPVITPSAARGIFDAVFLEPGSFRWQVTRVDVLAQPRYIALRRNEVKDKGPSASKITEWMAGKAPPEPLWADADKAWSGTDQKGRTQRQTIALKDVRYRLYAEMRLWRPDVGKLACLESQYERRARQGKCFMQPSFGCREFPAYFAPVETAKPPENGVNLDVGLMLYDVHDLSRPYSPWDGGEETWTPHAISLFRAKVVAGVMRVPDWDSEEVLKATGRGTHA